MTGVEILRASTHVLEAHLDDLIQSGQGDSPEAELVQDELISREMDNDFDYEDFDDYPVPDEPQDFMSDAEADADVLRSAGWGTDEDYGYFGDEPFGGDWGETDGF